MRVEIFILIVKLKGRQALKTAWFPLQFFSDSTNSEEEEEESKTTEQLWCKIRLLSFMQCARLSFNGIWWSDHDTAGNAGGIVENGSKSYRNWTVDIEKEQGKSKSVGEQN